MTSADLGGSTVNIGDNDYTNAIELIQFFHPEYRVIQRDEVMPRGDKLIFEEGVSPAVALSLRERNDKSVIYLAKTDDFDYDFTDRVEVLKFVYAKWGIDALYLFSEDDIENIKRMELFDFYNYIKPRWINKDFCLCDETTTIINIHSIIGKGFDEILRFSRNITDENVPLLEMGIIQFIEIARLKPQSKSKVYFRYGEIYKRFNACFSNDYIALALSKYREMVNNKRFRLIWLLSQFSFDRAVHIK